MKANKSNTRKKMKPEIMSQNIIQKSINKCRQDRQIQKLKKQLNKPNLIVKSEVKQLKEKDIALKPIS